MRVITIGREKDNDVVVSDVKVSRNHLQIAQDDNGGFTVVDLGSTNGTFVNGERITASFRLQAGDKVRIGGTTLPWQSYFETKTALPSSQQPIVEPPKKPSRAILYVVGAIVLLLLIGGGITYKVVNDKKQEKIEAENAAKVEESRLQQEIQQKDAEARRLQSEADSLWKAAVNSNSEEARRNRELAERKQQEANAAKNAASNARQAQMRAERQRDDALEAKRTAEEQRAEADQKAREERRLAEAATAKANAADAERLEAVRAAELTTEFHRTFRDVRNAKLVAICQKLGLPPADYNADNRKIIEDHFEKSNNQRKAEIIRALKEAIGQQDQEDRVTQDSTRRATAASVAQKPQEDSLMN